MGCLSHAARDAVAHTGAPATNDYSSARLRGLSVKHLRLSLSITFVVATLTLATGCTEPTTSPPDLRSVSSSVVPGGTAYGGVSAGGYHTCAVKTDGAVVCWGNLGQGNIATTVPASATSISQVSAGGLFTCGLKTDGTVICWGESSSGQLVIPPTATSVTQLATGYYHACALRTDATLVCWGDDSQNQSTVPAAAATTIAYVSAGGYHSCAAKTDGSVVCWGYNGSGQISVPASATTVAQVASGFLHTCGLKSDGSVVCWGDNGWGQINVPPAATSVTQITAGYYHTCALKADGTVICWGSGPQGQIAVPASATAVAHVTAGLLHTCAGKTDGTAICWGYNGNGQASVPGGLNLITMHPQAITFTSTSPQPAFVGANYVVAATGGGSGNPVTFGSLTTATCTVTGGLVDFLAAGTCNIVANQDGSTNYFAAPQVTQSVTVVEVNVAPVVTAITLPVNPVPIATAVGISAAFTDGNASDAHSANISWDDGTITAEAVSEAGGAGTVSAYHAYAAAGVYTVKAVVSDGNLSGTRSSALDVPAFVVVFDPSAGFVTGGGWITSPEGAFPANPVLTGKASFGFVSKYKPGASSPSGNTGFQFHAANFTFSSTTYEWLVVAGATAKFKGTGVVNGTGNYRFMLSAVDGHINGGGGVDRFRIKIWDLASGDVVYDNQMGSSENSEASTALGGGSIVIHR